MSFAGSDNCENDVFLLERILDKYENDFKEGDGWEEEEEEGGEDVKQDEEEETEEDIVGPAEARDYQKRALQVALKRNTIVTLGTGLGKTLIAVLLLKEQQPRRAKAPAGETAFDVRATKLSVFVVPTVPLVTQQAATIRRNTELRVMELHGSTGAIDWTEENWKTKLSSVEVIVVVAGMLLDSLLKHGRLSLTRDVNVLILDECHHATLSDNPYSVIMRKHFRNDSGPRPRVLGLTASPCVRKKGIGDSLHYLETLLEAKILPMDDTSAFDQSVREAPLRFDIPELVKSTEGELIRQMPPSITKELWGDMCLWAHVCLQVGVDYTRAYMKEEEIQLCSRDMIEKLDPAQSYTSILRDLVLSETPQRGPRPCAKFRQLQCLLSSSLADVASRTGGNEMFEAVATFRAIIFVERRHTCSVLSFALNQYYSKSKVIRADCIVGSSNEKGSNSLKGHTIAHQRRILARFAKGDINVLVATAVAQEGISVPTCNVCIMYDAPPNVKAYIQSRGRARATKSEFIMFEPSTVPILQEYQDDEQEIVRQLKIFAQSNGAEMFQVEERAGCGENIHFYKVESTGAKVDKETALSLLNNYCQTISPLASLRIHTTDTFPFQSTIYLPRNVGITEFSSAFFNSKKDSRRHAALLACRYLHQCGQLTDRLLPLRAEDVSSQFLSHEQTEVEIVHDRLPFSEEHVYLARFSVANQTGQKNQLAMGLLLDVRGTVGSERIKQEVTKMLLEAPRSQFASMPAYARDGTVVVVNIDSIVPAKLLSSKLLYRFSAGVGLRHPSSGVRGCFDVFDGLVHGSYVAVNEDGDVDWRRMEAMVDVTLQDRTEEERGFFWPLSRSEEYYDSHRLPEELPRFLDLGPPLNEATRRSKLLAVRTINYKGVLQGSPGVTCGAYIIGAYLNVAVATQYMSRLIEKPIELPNYLEAISSRSACCSKSYERMEVLGDTVLKVVCCAEMFGQTGSSVTEQVLTDAKSYVVSNEVMRKGVMKARATGEGPWELWSCLRWQSMPQWRKVSLKWMCNDAVMSGRDGDEIGHIWTPPEKQQADVVESMIGLGFLSCGFTGAQAVIRSLGLFTVNTCSIDNVVTSKEIGDKPGIRIPEWVSSMEEAIGYQFRNKELALEATTHITACEADNTNTYERLEFLGDALIDFVVVTHAAIAYPEAEPRHLHDVKSACVSNQALSRACVRMGLHKFLRCSKYVLRSKDDFVEYLEMIEDNEDYVDFWTNAGPKALADMLEATVGAVWVDGSVDKAREVAERLLRDTLKTHSHEPGASDVLGHSPIRKMNDSFPTARIRWDEKVDHHQPMSPFKAQLVLRCGRKEMSTLIGRGETRSMARVSAAARMIRAFRARPDVYKRLSSLVQKYVDRAASRGYRATKPAGDDEYAAVKEEESDDSEIDEPVIDS